MVPFMAAITHHHLLLYLGCKPAVAININDLRFLCLLALSSSSWKWLQLVFVDTVVKGWARSRRSDAVTSGCHYVTKQRHRLIIWRPPLAQLRLARSIVNSFSGTVFNSSYDKDNFVHVFLWRIAAGTSSGATWQGQPNGIHQEHTVKVSIRECQSVLV